MEATTIKDYLRYYVESITDKSKGGSYICPLCGSGTGRNHTGAFNIDPKDPTRWKCFKCEESGDIFDLIGKYENIPEYTDQLARAREILGDTPAVRSEKRGKTMQQEAERDYSAYLRECAERISDERAQAYLTSRGLSGEIAKRFKLGYDPHYKGETGKLKWQALIIPTSSGSFVVRNIDPNNPDRYRKTGEARPLNLDTIGKAEKPVFIVEGEIDALSIMEVGGEAVGLGSVSNKNKLINYLKEHKPSQPLILALDNDEAGERAQEELRADLQRLKIEFCEAKISGGYKDPNLALTNSREAFTSAIKEAELEAVGILEAKKEAEKAEYLKSAASTYIDGFMSDIIENSSNRVISTGFRNLDKALDGGLYPGLYIIGAISSLGKTTLALQIADQIAQQGRDVMIISLEMARSELMARSISRLTFLHEVNTRGKIQNAKTFRGIMSGARYEKYSTYELDTIDAAISDYKKYASHVFIYEGIGDIGVEQVKEIVQQHVSVTGNKPILFIDYLQILAPYDQRSTDKRNTDKAVLELKRLSRDFEIPVIGISSFNRDSYKEGSGNKGRVTQADFKESGAIEYSADVLIGLEFVSAGTKDYSEKVEKRKEPREIRLVVIKNRNGKPWETAIFNYHTLFNCYDEAGEETDPEPKADVFKGMK